MTLEPEISAIQGHGIGSLVDMKSIRMIDTAVYRANGALR
jgi:hypothetical protein